jgi:hypothetical protein
MGELPLMPCHVTTDTYFFGTTGAVSLEKPLRSDQMEESRQYAKAL